jgi:hypothetical protein
MSSRIEVAPHLKVGAQQDLIAEREESERQGHKMCQL